MAVPNKRTSNHSSLRLFVCVCVLCVLSLRVRLPCRQHALPYHALPCHALPCAALPCATLPCLALPCLASPCAAVSCQHYLFHAFHQRPSPAGHRSESRGVHARPQVPPGTGAGAQVRQGTAVHGTSRLLVSPVEGNNRNATRSRGIKFLSRALGLGLGFSLVPF